MRTLIFFAAAAMLAAQSDRTITADAAPGELHFSANGETITTLCRDNHIRTWEVATGKLVSAKPVTAGTTLLSATRAAERPAHGTVRIWDLTAGAQLRLINGAPNGRTVMSGNGKQLAVANANERKVRLVNLETGEQRHALEDGIGGAAELVFSPDGEFLVSANYDNDVRVWKTRSGELVRKVEDLTGAMFAGEFTPDGKQLVMAGLDETVYIWDANSFSPARTFKGHGETISALAISPDGRTLVTGGFDVITTRNPVKVAFWDMTTGKIIRTVKSPHRVVSLAFSPDGKWVAMTAGEKEINLWKAPASN
ncbi:MAG: WD40 repeat domain-containing protein [Acidobacteriia bacterium]|nr:WD40 repeat domain-containing protein [Terriglobia bacterium]